MKILKAWLVLLILLLVGAGVFIVSGAYNFAADEPHWSTTEALIGYARHRSVDAQAADITVPKDLSAPSRLAGGAEQYQAMCAGCHLAPGQDSSALRDGLYPRPPDLTDHGIHDPRSAFWVIKHGIKMSGMPAWGTSHDDETLWDLVALLQTLPELSESQWSTLTDGDTSTTHPSHGQGHGGGHSH